MLLLDPLLLLLFSRPAARLDADLAPHNLRGVISNVISLPPAPAVCDGLSQESPYTEDFLRWGRTDPR